MVIDIFLELGIIILVVLIIRRIVQLAIVLKAIRQICKSKKTMGF